jgi:hypothetical protein
MSPLKHAIHPRPKGQGILAWLRKRGLGGRDLALLDYDLRFGYSVSYSPLGSSIPT